MAASDRSLDLSRMLVSCADMSPYVAICKASSLLQCRHYIALSAISASVYMGHNLTYPARPEIQ